MSTHPIPVGGSIPLADILPVGQFVGGTDVQIQSCCSRWDECQPNDVYVAIVDSESDGHDFAAEAVRRGASAVVTERLLAVQQPQCIVPDSRRALGQVCHALAGHPTSSLPTFGVAGTDGKTVTAHFLKAIFDCVGTKSGILSSIQADNGDLAPILRSPGTDRHCPPQLAASLADMLSNGCSQSIIEMSSVDLAQRTYAGLQLDAAIITNLRTDHLGFHGSRSNTRRATRRVLEYLKPTGFAVINADDPCSNALLDELDCPALTVGLKQPAEISARIIERSPNEQVFLLIAGNESAVVRSSMIGDQNIYNCLAAAAVALTAGIELPQIATGLSSASVFPGRMEPVQCGQPFNIWIDSARSLNQLSAALHAVNRVTKGDVWCVCSTDERQSEQHRVEMGKILERAVRRPVITRQRIEKVLDFEPTHQVLDGFRKPGNAEVIPNRLTAIEWVLSQAKSGDSVLIAGAGEKPIASLETEGWSISDRDVCRAWLYDQNLKLHDSEEPGIYRIDDYRS